MTEDEMVVWHHRLNGHGFGWTLGVGDGQGALACYSSWGRKESDTTEQLNSTEEQENGHICWECVIALVLSCRSKELKYLPQSAVHCGVIPPLQLLKFIQFSLSVLSNSL